MARIKATARTVSLPHRQLLMQRWLHILHEKFPAWGSARLESIALGALANFYAFFDQQGEVEPWDLLPFLSASEETPGGIAVRHIVRIFGALRLALKDLIKDSDHEALNRVYEALDAWQELVLLKYETTLLQQSRVHRAEIVQRMADINTMNYCAAALNSSLDLAASLHATACLCRDLTNADITAVYFSEHDEYFLRSSARSERALCLPPLRESAGSGVRIGETVIRYDSRRTAVIDSNRQDMPIDVPRIGTGISQLQAVICIPLHAGQVSIGRIVVGFLEPQEFPTQKIRMLEIFANHAGQAIYNAMLFEQMAEMAVVQERQRIACEMHDTMLQTLVSLNINLRVAIWRARQGDWEEALRVFEQARQLGKVAVQEGRDALSNLREECFCPGETENLSALIQPIVAVFSEQSGLIPDTHIDESLNLPPLVAHQLSRIVGEALNNIYRHASATAVAIRVEQADDKLRLRIADDGVGFDLSQTGMHGSFGLSGMRERARLINAQLTIDSSPGIGTVIEVRWHNQGAMQRFPGNENAIFAQFRKAESSRVSTVRDEQDVCETPFEFPYDRAGWPAGAGAGST